MLIEINIIVSQTSGIILKIRRTNSICYIGNDNAFSLLLNTFQLFTVHRSRISEFGIFIFDIFKNDRHLSSKLNGPYKHLLFPKNTFST